MSVIHQPRRPEYDARVLLFPSILLVLLSLIFLRLWFFQVVQSEELVERAASLNASTTPVLAPRGLIYDRNGVMIAGVKPEWVVTAVPKIIDKNPEVLGRLSAELGIDVKRLKAKVEEGRWKPWMATPIHIGASTKIASSLAERSNEFPGIDIRSQPMRYYPDSRSFSHMMGYVWVPSPEDVKRIRAFGREPADYVGKGGLESKYEQQLMGEIGETRYEVDSKRRPTRVLGRDAPVPGDQLILSIDKNLQQEAMAALEGKRGAVVALDPKTGEVLCLASAPSFDLKLFKTGISKTDFDRLQQDPRNPFLNRPIQVKFAPGSTFKIVTSIAAMQQGLFDPNRPEYCRGGIQLGNRFIRCLGNHGSVTFHRAMTKSCNAYFMSLALKAKRAGMLQASLDTGMYEKTGIDLPSERRGDLPTERYMERYYPTYRWPLADTAFLGIGQGILAVTPIQMANVAAMVANNGVTYKPHMVRAIRNSMDFQKIEKVAPEQLHQVKGDPAFWSAMRASLVNVIEGGTAGSARIPGITWGGKTGSAEQKKGNLTHSWFVGFAPYDNPKIAICVFVEQAGHGGEVAAPIAKKVVQRYLLPPKDSIADSNSGTRSNASRALDSVPAER